MIRRVALTFAILAAGGSSLAAETRTWSAGAAELLRGEADGIAISGQGRLFLAPRMQRLDDALAGAATLEAWSACPGGPGEVFFGTGPDGVVYRTDGNGRGREYFRTGETMVTALLRLADGTLLAGTSPGGRVYRIDAERRGALWVETGERYVWALAESDGGNVYAGTGERGKVLRLRPDGSTETHFDSDEPHIVALLHDGEGTLVAGGAGVGRLYEIDIDGNGLVLYDDDLDEARSIVRWGADGWTVALVGASQRTAEKPELRLRLPDGVNVEPNVPLEERRGPTLRGVIEGLGSEAATVTGPRGRLIRVDRSGRSVVLWESSSETPLSLAVDATGRVVMGTGEPARLYRVEPGDEIALLATLREAHVTALARSDRTLFAGTSNPAAVWRVEAIDAEQGAYVSPPHDAGTLARWGSISWAPRKRLARTEVYTRTGNSPRPDATWSAWSPAQVLADGSPADNPDGRYAQFRVRFIGSQEADARLGGVTLRYETYNRAPVLVLDPLAEVRAVGRTASLEWKARDPDGDPLEAVLEYRAVLSDGWTTLDTGVRIEGGKSELPVVQSGTLEWDTTGLIEGLYDIRLAVTDQASNDLAEGHRTRGAIYRVAVDRNAPSIDVRRLPDGRIEVVLSDEVSGIGGLTLLRDGRTAARVRSVDGVCDSRRERFEFALPQAAAEWKLRGEDLAGNTVEADVPFE